MIQNMRTLNGKVNWISYYTFKYFDFDELLKNVSSLTKTQMVLSSDFVGEVIIFRIEIDWKQKYIDCLNNDKIEDVMRKGILWQ